MIAFTKCHGEVLLENNIVFALYEGLRRAQQSCRAALREALGVAELNRVSPHAPAVRGDMGDSAASVVLSDLETSSLLPLVGLACMCSV